MKRAHQTYYVLCMTCYSETRTFCDWLNAFATKATYLEGVISEVKKINSRTGEIRRPRTQQETKRLVAAQSSLKTINKKIQRLTRLNVPSWDVMHVLQDAENTLWRDKNQIDMWHKDLAIHEGRGEASLRDWHGLAPASSSQRELDIPELGIEVKNVQGRSKNGRFSLQSIQAGSSGRRAYTVWMVKSAMSGSFNGLSEDDIIALASGEVSQSMLYGTLSEDLRSSLLEAVKPSIVFKHAKALEFTTRNGFLHVDLNDIDTALSTTCITKCGPKYALKTSYLTARLRSHTPTVIAA